MGPKAPLRSVEDATCWGVPGHAPRKDEKSNYSEMK